MKVRVTFTARRDLNDIFDFLNRRSPRSAKKLLRDIEAAIELIAAYPKASPLTSEAGVRVKVLRRYQYLIFYQIRPDAIELLRVRHGARRTELRGK